jgi:hypothetical protein
VLLCHQLFVKYEKAFVRLPMPGSANTFWK